MRRALAAALLLALAAVPARPGEPIDDHGWLLATEIQLPPADDPASEWARFDVPAVLHAFLIDGFDDLRLVDGAGREVERLVLPDRGVLEERRIELSLVGRADGEARVLLAGPGDAPDTLLLPDVEPGVEVTVEGALTPDAWYPITKSAAGHGGRVPLPAFCARMLRVRAAGASLTRVTGVWQELRPMRGAALSPRVHGNTYSDGVLRIDVDLGVRRAPGLLLECELAVVPNGSVRGFSVPFPAVDYGERMRWQPDPEAPADRVRGTFEATKRGQRYVRIEVPTTDPGAARVVRLAASVTRQRVFFRRKGVVEPVRLLAGKSGLGAPEYPLTKAAATFVVGLPATFDAPDWRFLRGPRPAADQLAVPREDLDQFPWAPLVATLLFVALTLAALKLHRA